MKSGSERSEKQKNGRIAETVSISGGVAPLRRMRAFGGLGLQKKWRKGLEFKRRSLRFPALYPLENSGLKASPPRGRVTQFGRANPTCAFRHARVSLCGTTPSLTWYRNPAVNGGLLQVSMLDLDCELLDPVSPRRFRVQVPLRVSRNRPSLCEVPVGSVVRKRAGPAGLWSPGNAVENFQQRLVISKERCHADVQLLDQRGLGMVLFSCELLSPYSETTLLP